MLRVLQTTLKLCILDAYMSMNFRSILYKNIGFRLHMEKNRKKGCNRLQQFVAF